MIGYYNLVYRDVIESLIAKLESLDTTKTHCFNSPDEELKIGTYEDNTLNVVEESLFLFIGMYETFSDCDKENKEITRKAIETLKGLL